MILYQNVCNRIGIIIIGKINNTYVTDGDLGWVNVNIKFYYWNTDNWWKISTGND